MIKKCIIIKMKEETVKFYICLISVALTAVFGTGSVFACGEKDCQKGFYIEGLANAAIPMEEDTETTAFLEGGPGIDSILW